MYYIYVYLVQLHQMIPERYFLEESGMSSIPPNTVQGSTEKPTTLSFKRYLAEYWMNNVAHHVILSIQRNKFFDIYGKTSRTLYFSMYESSKKKIDVYLILLIMKQKLFLIIDCKSFQIFRKELSQRFSIQYLSDFEAWRWISLL